MINKIPPNNKDAEESLISAVLINNENFEFCEDLNPHEFYNIGHQKIFRAMLTLNSKKIPVDLVTVSEELNKRGELSEVGGAAYLSTIADSAPMAVNCKAYADIISDLSLKRDAIKFSLTVHDKAFSNSKTDDVGELIEFIQSEALNIQQSKRGDSIFLLRDILHGHIDRIEHDNRTPQESYLSFGFPRLDRLMNISGPKFILIAGRPSMGKTALAVTCMRNLARRMICCGFLSIEMGRDEIINRWLAMETGINNMKYNVYNGLNDHEFSSIVSAAGEMDQWPVFIDDTGSIGIEDVERKSRKMVRDGAQILFIDQLSKIKGKTGDQFKDYTTNCNRIADLKKELRVPVVLLSQLNRDLEKRADKRPTLADLKNTGSLEEDPDIVIFLYRPEYYINPKNPNEEAEKEAIKDNAEINIAKNRNGARYCDKHMKFDHGRGMFYQGDIIS